MRSQLSLDGTWRFRMDDEADWRWTDVPKPWQADFDDLRLTPGVAWYERDFKLLHGWQGQRIWIHFGAVDYFAEVWVNDQKIGEHEGGYLPFEFDITDAVKWDGLNTVRVRVIDPGKEAPEIDERFPFFEIPHGKQSWYGPVGGLWQSVWLEARAETFVKQAYVTPEDLDGTIAVGIDVHGEGASEFVLEVRDPSGEPVTEVNVPALTGNRVTLHLPDPVLWWPDSPALYTLHVKLLDRSGDAIDHFRTPFGIRTIEARDGRLYLNGRPFYMRAALDQDYYAHGIYTPPSLPWLREQMRQAKRLGLNCLRCHIKAPDPRYLQAADEEGVLIWADVPNWGILTEDAKRRGAETFKGMVARDFNHPSLIMWSLINEAWGIDMNDPDQRAWLAGWYADAKQIDPTRLIVDNSACGGNFHVATDVDDFHQYRAVPEGMPGWEAWLDDFVSRPDWTFAPEDDPSVTRTREEPLIVSEFGSWGLPDLDLLEQSYGGEPWWYATGEERGVVHPVGVRERFHAQGIDRAFADFGALARACQWRQYGAWQAQIEAMLARPQLSGYVITELNDLHWECNGLLDMARNPRIYARYLSGFMADTVIFMRCDLRAYRAGETVKAKVYAHHYGGRALKDVPVRLSINGHPSGALTVSAEPGELAEAGEIAFTLPHVAAPTRITVQLALGKGGGRHLAANSYNLTVLPEMGGGGLPVRCDDETLAAWLDDLGYAVGDEGPLVTRDAARTDEAALILLSEPAKLPGDREVVERASSDWAGNWASSFVWLPPALSPLPGGCIVGADWLGAAPEWVLPDVAAQDTLSGVFVGWLRRPAATIARVGDAVLSGYPAGPEVANPLSEALLHRLIRYASGG